MRYHPVVAEQDGLCLRCVQYDHNNRIKIASDVGNRAVSTAFFTKTLALVRGHIEAMHDVTGAEKRLCHAISHRTEAKEGNPLS